DRLGYMLADAQVSVLLSQPHLLVNLPSHQAQVVTLEGQADAIAAQPKTTPTTVITSENLAYVIYTSGSTGRPKGVMISHKGLGNLAANLIKTFAITATSRVLQFASPSFDASIMEMLMALGADACLCSGTSESLLTGSNLIGFLNEQAISHALLAPSALAVLKPETLPNLEVLIVGGEACPVSLMKQWAKGPHFFNAYGPTEATICTTIAPCQPEDETITIGRPLANTEIYILDTYGQPVPIGVPGELHIGGIGLAKGYLNRRDLTQEKFVEIKGCEALTGKRLYKTGDRVRYHCDGSIEFLGRIDHQVKLRGFRIELGEVSATLEKHPAVQAAIALVREDRPGDKHLVAYVIGQDDYCEISPTELREFLRGQLPNYMVPTAVVLLSEFPLTPNGKLDRHALPPPLLGKARSQKLPKTEVEHKIAAIWQQILTVEVVGLDDNFFELGGHSLLLAQLQQQLQDCFGTDIPIVELFARPTVGTLAQFFSSPAVLSTGQPTLTESKEGKRQRVSKLRKRQQQIRGRYHFRGDR
ncbi:MAG: amino acid adenylation domain-containing protein, partial [Moorea sp. SIO4G2]|nr:amino acid adenylation domain-containing protein [Moorena sp. SIO4G2]